MVSIKGVTFFSPLDSQVCTISHPENSLVILQKQLLPDNMPHLSFHLYHRSHQQPRGLVKEAKILEILLNTTMDYGNEPRTSDPLTITKEVWQLSNLLFTYYTQKIETYSVDQLLLYLVNQIVQVNTAPLCIDPAFSTVVKFMEENVFQKLSSDDFCRALHFSPASLNRLCRKCAKKSVMALFREIKCRKAENLLVESSLSILEISSTLGFRNGSHFTTTFKKINGVSPLKWRKTRKGVSK